MSIARLISSIAFGSLAAAAALASKIEWPEPQLPADTRYEDAGASMRLNGMPLRVLRFRTSHPPDEIIREFAKTIDDEPTTPAAVPGAAGEQATGGRRGDFWLTLRWRQDGSQTIGTWSAAPVFDPDARQPIALPQGFPQRATLLQQVDSYDADKRSQLAVGMDGAAVDAVAAQLESRMLESGYRKQNLNGRNWVTPQQYVAVFSRAREEIYVTLQQERGGTNVVINRITALEQLK